MEITEKRSQILGKFLVFFLQRVFQLENLGVFIPNDSGVWSFEGQVWGVGTRKGWSLSREGSAFEARSWDSPNPIPGVDLGDSGGRIFPKGMPRIHYLSLRVHEQQS